MDIRNEMISAMSLYSDEKNARPITACVGYIGSVKTFHSSYTTSADTVSHILGQLVTL